MYGWINQSFLEFRMKLKTMNGLEHYGRPRPHGRGLKHNEEFLGVAWSSINCPESATPGEMTEA
jgi:hypothetical protein